jgi:hypothetical protein
MDRAKSVVDRAKGLMNGAQSAIGGAKSSINRAKSLIGGAESSKRRGVGHDSSPLSLTPRFSGVMPGNRRRLAVLTASPHLLKTAEAVQNA